MPSIAKRLSFYRACYQADSRELQLDDVSTFKAERWGWLDGREELASGAMPFAALSAELGEHLLQQQNLYQRELQLIYGVLPVCGRRSDAEGRTVRHCAPLVYFEARLESLGEARRPAWPSTSPSPSSTAACCASCSRPMPSRGWKACRCPAVRWTITTWPT